MRNTRCKKPDARNKCKKHKKWETRTWEAQHEKHKCEKHKKHLKLEKHNVSIRNAKTTRIASNTWNYLKKLWCKVIRKPFHCTPAIGRRVEWIAQLQWRTWEDPRLHARSLQTQMFRYYDCRVWLRALEIAALLAWCGHMSTITIGNKTCIIVLE